MLTTIAHVCQMDAAVANSLNRGNGLYAVDEDLLVELQPTHIITQDLCNVTSFLLSKISREDKGFTLPLVALHRYPFPHPCSLGGSLSSVLSRYIHVRGATVANLLKWLYAVDEHLLVEL
jgi:hypothetical protein